MATKKPRKRSSHPGVKLNKRTLPSGRVQWRARYTDPDTGKVVDVTLDPVALPTNEARVQWAKVKSQAIKRRVMELEAGGPPRVEGEPIDAALAAYLDDAQHRLRPKTLATYGLAYAKLKAWGKQDGVKTTTDLTQPRLAALRTYLIAQPKKTAKRGARRGQFKDSDNRRVALSVNRELRTLKTLFSEWRRAGLLPNDVDSDAIKDTLRALPVPRDEPEFLAPPQIRKVLEAALRHDAAVFAETRQEHAGLRPKGTTSRYMPIAPFIAVLLLTGMRRGEALAIKWHTNVDLNATNPLGEQIGHIRLRAKETKIHRARTINLEVSPMARQLLACLLLRAGCESEGQHVFGGTEPYTENLVEKTRQRLMTEYGAPAFDYKTLRSTCSTFLTNSQVIFGDATVFLSAKQLGHSVAVAEKHYLNVYDGVPKDAATVEDAMQIADVVRQVIEAVSGNAGNSGPVVRLVGAAER